MSSTGTTFSQIEARTRRRLLAACLLRIAFTTVLLLVLYYLLPLGDFAGTLGYFVLGSVIFVGTLAWQVRCIVGAKYPRLRAIEAVGVALPLLVIVFATVYLSMVRADPTSFSEQLSRSASLYFTITVLSTVGFGDITPKTDTARLVVSAQMVIDLAIIGVILKLIVGAARVGLERQGEPANQLPANPSSGRGIGQSN